MLQVKGTQVSGPVQAAQDSNTQQHIAWPQATDRQAGRQTGRQRLMQHSRSQVWEDHLKEQHAHAVHVKLVRVVEAPQDGREEGCHRQGGRSWGLHDTYNFNCSQALPTQYDNIPLLTQCVVCVWYINDSLMMRMLAESCRVWQKQAALLPGRSLSGQADRH